MNKRTLIRLSCASPGDDGEDGGASLKSAVPREEYVACLNDVCKCMHFSCNDLRLPGCTLEKIQFILRKKLDDQQKGPSGGETCAHQPLPYPPPPPYPCRFHDTVHRSMRASFSIPNRQCHINTISNLRSPVILSPYVNGMHTFYLCLFTPSSMLRRTESLLIVVIPRKKAEAGQDDTLSLSHLNLGGSTCFLQNSIFIIPYFICSYASRCNALSAGLVAGCITFLRESSFCSYYRP